MAYVIILLFNNMKSLSRLIFKTFESDINFKFLATKVNNKWNWVDRKQLYYNIVDCRNVLIDYRIKKGDRVAFKGDNSINWISCLTYNNCQNTVSTLTYNALTRMVKNNK